MSIVSENIIESEGMTMSYNGRQQNDIEQLSFVQPIERSLKLGRFNREKIEKLKILLRNL